MKLLIDNGSGYVDYTQYVVPGSLQVQDAINVPTLTTFVLVNTDASFVVPSRSSYFRLVSEKDGKVLASGFVTNESMRTFQGLSGRAAAGPRSTGFQMYQYTVKCTSDEWLLNVNTIPFLPAFINRTQGEILSQLADLMAPGFFDVTAVASGDVIPYYQYSSEKTWSDVAKTFADSVRYRYKVIDRAITYQPFGDDLLGVTYDETGPERSFDPRNFQADVLTVPPVNDATVLGSTEPKTNWDSFFVGDGFTGNFPLNHAAFEGGTSVVLQEDWTGSSFSQTWKVFDPGLNFSLDGALNVIGGLGLGQSYIECLNGVELGGALFLQHGEIEWNDICSGIVGGVYSSSVFSQANCVAGFNITSGTVVPSASGASGINMQPLLFGSPIGPVITSRQNHHYILQTIIHGRRWDRYDRLFNSLQGTQFGGTQQSSLGDITFLVLDIDLGVLVYNPLIPITFLPNPTVVMRYTATGLNIPSFGDYVPINSANLNMTMWYTLLAFPPQGKLMVRSMVGPTGGMLPVLPSNLGSELQYTFGSGFQLQTATLGKLGDVDQLQFYNDQLPAVGARIRLQTWEAQQAAARVRDSARIAAEGKTSGDSGVRSAIMTDLQPLPRTSEECELAARAAIVDRSTPQYQGAYTVFDYFWNAAGDYPMSGRYLAVNSPARNVNTNMLVMQVTTTVVELRQEILQFQIQFGPDMYLEKLLAKFLERTESLLLPANQGHTLTPLEVSQVGSYYGPNLDNAKIADVTGSTVVIDVGSIPATGVEVRRVDAGWGTPDANFIGIFPNQQFTMPRVQRKQQWFMRLKNGGTYSRYSKGIYVDCPLTPAQPTIAKEDVTDWAHPTFTFDYGSGDIRDVYGLEVRAADNTTVLLQRVVTGPADLVYVMDNTSLSLKNGTIYVYFFNLMWNYSSPLIHVWDPLLLSKLMTASHASYRPLTNPLTAHDTGTNVTISIASFTMRCPLLSPSDIDITINSGTITALAYSTVYYIFYDDPRYLGGAVTYQFTTTKENALNGEARFFVGSIKTPVQGGPDTIGNDDGGAGAQYNMKLIWQPGLGLRDGSEPNGTPGNFGWVNPLNAIDGDYSTFATNDRTNPGFLSGVEYFFYKTLQATPGTIKKATLYVRYNIVTPSSLSHTQCAWLDYYNGQPAHYSGFVFDVLPGSGTTGLVTFSVNLPLDTAFRKLYVQAIVPEDSTVDIYDVWLELS